mmetsp:Transcript_21184/g.24255  ORF Transcript_21184/g.24255 Transcript_21184/m.24255 type:complete len:494 (+) Transcript_21184:412-1893(+)
MYSNNTIPPPRVYLYDTHNTMYEKCLSIPKYTELVNKYKYEYKHGGEVWFLEQIKYSPWRTYNPNDADLFVLPLLPGFSLNNNNHNNNDNDNDEYGSCLLEMLLMYDRIVQTTFFKKNDGRNHILLSTHYLSHRKTINWCPKCIHFHQGNTDELTKSLSLPLGVHNNNKNKKSFGGDDDEGKNNSNTFYYYDYMRDYYFNDYKSSSSGSDGIERTLLSAPMVPQLYLNRLPHQRKMTPHQTKILRGQNTTEFLQLRNRAFYFAGQADKRRAYNGRRQIQSVWELLRYEQRQHQQQIIQRQYHDSRNSGLLLDNDNSYNVPNNNVTSNNCIIDDFVFVLKGGNHNSNNTAANNSCDHNRSSSSGGGLFHDFTHDVSTTRFGLQARGDNPTSSRLYEWIDVGAIPVIIIDDAWLPGRYIPWNDMSIRISESLSDEELKMEFYRIAYELPTKQHINEITRMREVLQLYAPAILWSDPKSVVAEVLIIDAWEVYQQQ